MEGGGFAVLKNPLLAISHRSSCFPATPVWLQISPLNAYAFLFNHPIIPRPPRGKCSSDEKEQGVYFVRTVNIPKCINHYFVPDKSVYSYHPRRISKSSYPGEIKAACVISITQVFKGEKQKYYCTWNENHHCS